MTITSIQLYEALSGKFGKDQAQLITDYVEAKIEKEFEHKKDVFLIKQDKIDIIKWVFASWLSMMLMIAGLYLRN